jgi:TonB family protein
MLMKKIVLAFCILCSITAAAQTEELFFDWKYKPCTKAKARFLSVRKQTDSGWLRTDFYLAGKNPLQMRGLYQDKECKIENGWFSFFYPDGKLSNAGRYIKKEKDGLWLGYHYNGIMSDSAMYENGQRKGTAIYWHRNGYISDSVVYNNDGTGVSVSWFDNGQPAEYGKIRNGKKEGKWQFLSIKGFKSATEEYTEGKLVSRTYYDAAGNALADTADRDKPAIFAGGPKDWQNYVAKNLQFPRGYKLVNTEMVTVVVAALVNEDGTVTDAFVQIPFDEAFDKEALRIFRKTPRWIAAVKYNRKVKTAIRQPITFGQQEE